MITGNEPAMPRTSLKQSGGQSIAVDFNYIDYGATGLTIRQHFAGMAMQGLMAVSDKGSMEWDEGVITAAKISVQAADALIKELNKTQ